MEFKYTATDMDSGKRISGVAHAESVSVLSNRLSSEHKIPITISRIKGHGKGRKKDLSKRKRKVKGRQVAIFTRQTAATLSAGLLLSDALQTVADSFGNAYFESVINRVREKVLSGQNLSSAMAAYPKIFSKAYVSVVRTGEATGQLHLTLSNLAKYLENIERLKDKVRGAIQYPAFIFSFATIVVAGIVTFIIPKFKEIFMQAGADLPWLTQAVLGASDFLASNFLWFFIGILVLGIIVKLLLRFPTFYYWFDVMKLKIPLLGKDIIHKSIITKFCNTLGFLMTSGVPIASSLDITAQVVNHKPVEQAVKKIKNRVLSGTSLSDAIREHQVFPLLVYKMSYVGEKTGRVAEMLEKASEYYNDELENTIQNLMVLIEPVLIICVGIIVAIIVVALYLPIFRVSLLI